MRCRRPQDRPAECLQNICSFSSAVNGTLSSICAPSSPISYRVLIIISSASVTDFYFKVFSTSSETPPENTLTQIFYYNTKTGACASAKCTKRLPLPELHVTVHSRYLSLLKNPRFFFSLCGASPLLTRSAACKLSSVASSNLRSSSFASAERCSGVCTTRVT